MPSESKTGLSPWPHRDYALQVLKVFENNPAYFLQQLGTDAVE